MGCIHRFARATAKCTTCGLDAIPFLIEEHAKMDGALRSILSELVSGRTSAAEAVARARLADVAEMMHDEADAKQLALLP